MKRQNSLNATRVPHALFLILAMLMIISGCGGGGGGDSTTSTPPATTTTSTLTGYVLVPSSTPTTSAKANILYYVKSLFFPDLSAASSTKPLDNAAVTIAKIDKDGKLSAVSSTTTTTDAQGKYTLSDVPEGTNLVIVSTKNVKDDTGAEKIVTLENLVTITADDLGDAKDGTDLKVDTTLAVENVKEMIVTANSGKSDSEKIDGSKLSSDKVEEIKTVYANYNADINEKSNPVDIITRDKDKSEEDHHKDVITKIEELKSQIDGLKSELETKINDILSSGTITGFVKDQNDNALSGATVSVTGGGLTGTKTATMFSNGQYTITLPISTTSYTVTISLTGYKTTTFTAVIDRLMTLTKDVTLTKLSSPVISSISASQTTVTPGTQVTLSVSASASDGDTLKYTWSANGGTISNDGIACIALLGVDCTGWKAPDTTGTYTITVKVSDGTNEVSASKDITVIAVGTTQNQNPTATASADVTSGTTPLTVKFTGSGSDSDGAISSYYWDFGDGTSSNEQNPSHTYTTAGTYSATITVSDNAGGKGTSSGITITATAPQNQPPTVTASATPSSGAAPLSVSFSASAKDEDWCKSVCAQVIQNAGTAQWDYNGDGTADWTSDFTNAGDTFTTSYSYTAAGTYTATFKATDKDSASSTKSVTVSVSAPNKAPTASAAANPASGTAPLAVQFTGSGTDTDGSISSYSWDFGDGSASTEQNPSHTFSLAGSYTVTLTVTDNGGATGKSTVVVTATNPATNQSPSATLSADKTSGTSPLTVSFTISYTDPEGKSGTYSLNYGDNSGTATGSITSGGTATVSHTYSSAGTFTAALTVTDDKSATGTASESISVSSVATVIQVSAGSWHTCAVTSTGGAKCWGSNAYGQIGNGTTSTTANPIPLAVSNLGIGVSLISAGWDNTCVLTSSGGVKCWGLNDFGQLGDGTQINRLTPVDVPGLESGISDIKGGRLHYCVLTSASSVKCWGANYYGEIGDGTQTNRLTPVDVSGLGSGITAIAVGQDHSCALTSSGGVKCWGYNAWGQLGDGTQIDRLTPVNVSGLGSGVIAVSAGNIHTCALMSSGGVKCWGRGNLGQLGNGTTSLFPSSPVDVSGLGSGVTTISAGNDHTCALLSSGGVKCWGSNLGGGLGDGTTDGLRSTPVDVYGLNSGVTAIASGYAHTCAIVSSGTVKCWGYNTAGQLGNGNGINSNVPVSVSSSLYAQSPLARFFTLVRGFFHNLIFGG